MVQIWDRTSATFVEFEAAGNHRDLARHLCAINSAPDLSNLLSVLHAAAKQFGTAIAAALLVVDGDGREWRLLGRCAPDAVQAASSAVVLDASLERQLVETDLALARRGDESDAFQSLWDACSIDANSILLAPIKIGSTLLGAFVVEFAHPHVRLPALHTLALIVQQATIVAQRTCQLDRMSRALDDLLAFNRVSDERCRSLQRTLDVHDQLIRILLDGQGLESIVTALGRILANPVAVEDQFGSVISYYLPGASGHDAGCSPEVNGVPKGLRDYPDAQSVRAHLRHTQRPSQLPPARNAGFPESRVVTPILVGNETLGYINILESNRALDDLDFVALERAAVVVALHMMKEKTAAETRYKLRGDLVAELVNGRYGSEEEMITRASYLGVDLTKPWAVLLVDIDRRPGVDAGGELGAGFLDTESRVLRVVERACISAETEAVVSNACHQIVVLARVRSDLLDLRRTVLQKLGDRLRGEVAFCLPNLSVSVGIGDCCDGLAQYQQSYQHALRAIDVIRASRQVNQTLAFDQLGIYDVLSDPHNRERLTRFVRDSIGRLIDYDLKHGTELVKTLEEFLTHDCHFVPTAEVLQLHTSTLRYRLERMAQLGVSVRGMAARCNLQLALKVLRVTQPNTR